MTPCFRNLWMWLVGALIPLGVLSAQIPDSLPNASQISPDRARQLLQSRPDLANQLRDRIGASGLTPDQVRARLRAAGYPSDLLDPYMGPSDSTTTVHPDANTVDALKMLGVVTPDDAAQLRRAAEGGLRPAAPSPTPLVDTVKVFGLDVFGSGTTQFQPTLGGPVGDNYVLGPGDVLALILTGQVETAFTLEVNREGFIVVPHVGQIYVANQTVGQLRQLLYSKLAGAYSGVSADPNARTHLQLSVGKLRSAQIFVIGAVQHPGAYDVSGSGTVLTALYSAGGPTARGSFRAVQVRRGDSLLGTIDLYDYLLSGRNRTDVKLATGDVVFVGPVGAQVKVTGEVVRPAIYEMRPGETLRDALRFAAGFTAEAARSRVQIHRVLPPQSRGDNGRDRVVVDVTADALRTGLGPPYPMEPGDSLVVFPIAGRQRARVAVRGDVWLEGNVGFTPGMKLSDAIRLAGGTKPDVYMATVLINRLRPDSTRFVLRSRLIDSTGRAEPDLQLQEDDEIELFNRTGFRDERYIAVTGAVRAAGRIPWHEGMTLRDAVLLAQGFRDEALLTEAEVARMPSDHANGALAVTVRVPLDSTYLPDRGTDGRYQGPPGVPTRASGAPEFLLQPYDNVLILRQPEWETPRTVYIGGQVMYPGRYTLQSRTDRLSDLLNRAGGLTHEAYAEGIVFHRALNNEGRIGVDLPAVLRDQKFRDNLIVQAGDSIVVPEFSPVVRIAGAVNAPISVAYVPGQNIDFYARAAGGYTRQADRGRAYVTQPDGKVQSVSRHFLIPDYVPDPLPGAVVFVPTKERREVGGPSLLTILATTASVIASLATVLIAAKR